MVVVVVGGGGDGNLWDLPLNLLRLFPRQPELADCGWETLVQAQSSCQAPPRHQINRGLLPHLAARLALPGSSRQPLTASAESMRPGAD